MDYTKVPRILIYKERSTLEDFGVYEPKSFNAALFDALMSLDDLKPRYEGVFGEILGLFNDAYYYLTQIFLEKNPLERYARYCDEAGAPPTGHDFDWDSASREMVVKCMLFVMLGTFGKNLPAPQRRLLTAMAADIDESNSYQDMGTALRRLRGEKEDIVYKITCKFQFNIMSGSISQQDYTRRDIQELLDSDVSLKECLSAGKVLREAVNILCKDKKQKLALIDRLLEPEKDGYGSLDIRITESYRSLYELKSELTGEPLPEQLPFEKARFFTPPMMATPPSILDYQKENKADEKDATIAELREKISQMEAKFEQYKQENSITQEQLEAIFPLNEETDGKHQQQVDIPQTDNNELLKTKAELEEKEKQLEEAQQCITELKAQVEEMKHQNEKSAKDSLDWLEDWQRLSARELAIFFAQALGVSFDPELVVQTQLANLAATWTKPQPDTIRAKIGKLFKEESDVNQKDLDGFSHKTKDEAIDVYYFIMRIVKHYSCITPQMNTILDNLNEFYNLGIVEKVDVNNKEKQITKKEIFDTIDKTRKSGEKNS